VRPKSRPDELLEGLGGKRESEDGTVPRRRRGAQLAAVGLDKTAADPETQARTGGAGLGSPEELREDPGQIRRRDPLALVAPRDGNHLSLFRCNAQLAAYTDALRIGVLRRVLD